MLSRSFDLARGTKQGDPLSPKIFNAVLEHFLRPIKKKWEKQNAGLRVSSSEAGLLSNLSDADDILLVESGKEQLHVMLDDLASTAGKGGLKIHSGKMKILTNSAANEE